MRTIKVTGRGRLNLRPDTTRLTLTLSGADPEYDAALSISASETKALGTAFGNVGFAREDLKTQSFNINTEYESYEENGSWKQRFIAYRYTHVLHVDFAADNERLGRVFAELANCPVNAELRISYMVKDQEAAKNELLANAIVDAGEKAGVLADAAGVTLGAIQSIDYSWGEINFEAHPMDSLARPLAAKASFDLNIEPDDIDVSDTVTVIWEMVS